MIGLFIGSFNPPTNAHLDIAKKLSKRYEKIVFVPVNSREKYLAPMLDRIVMLRILKRKYPFLLIDDIMDKYSFLNYRLLDLLKKKYSDIEIIMGSDLLKNLVFFDNYAYLLSSFHFLIVSRDNNDEDYVKEKYFKYQKNFNFFKYHSDISSTMVREAIKNKGDVKALIDSDVYQYIQDKHLYF